MASIENFYKNIKVEEEKKLLTTSPKDGGSLESFYKSIPSEETEKQNTGCSRYIYIWNSRCS
jgi:hypothetical protein